ncbi:acetylserotonin O-methyltransferase [Myxococcus sp. K38C18041901]|uniref:acetylserotonin O-methyltransferase n=1 Tax=Myxococcus guangdongensis TaxID=2906760 RepID=UPI0020A7AE29|nr:acetylserotonin O-methyltransferase [Myxococcus guangdongensis]MCP3060322.1 acetylserotonin O-methyltransferase [Myxococcus guangdongensis]
MSQQPRSVNSVPSAAPSSPPAAAVMTQMVYGFWISRSLQIMAELGIADIIGDVPKTAEELAQASGTYAPALRRMLRLLSGLGVLIKDEETQAFALTELGVMLRKDSPGSVYGSLRAHGHLLSWSAWGDLVSSLKTGQPSVEKFMGDSFFGYLSSHPEDAAIFNGSMAAYQSLNAPAVVGAYDFTQVRSVVDVGGGTGTLLGHILQSHPHLKGALFELPHVKAEATARLNGMGLGNRCQVLEGDFFAKIPAGHDVYILSQILHDWDDERSLKILTNMREAMGPQSKLLIVETVLPGDNVQHFGNLYDMAMLVLVGGRERTGPEYSALVEKAGLRVHRVLPTYMPPSVVEVVPA